MATSAPPSAWISAAGSWCDEIHRVGRAEHLCHVELCIDQVDGGDGRAGDTGVLDSKVPETTDTEYGHKVRRPRTRDFHCLVCRDTGAGERGGVEGVDRVGDSPDEGRFGDEVLGEPAIDAVAGIAGVRTQCLPAGCAQLTGAAGPPEPRHCHAISFAETPHSFSEALNDADTFVAGNEWRLWLDRPVTVCGVDVGVAQTGGLDLDQDFTVAGLGGGDVLDLEWLVEAGDDCGLHGYLLGECSLTPSKTIRPRRSTEDPP